MTTTSTPSLSDRAKTAARRLNRAFVSPRWSAAAVIGFVRIYDGSDLVASFPADEAESVADWVESERPMPAALRATLSEPR